MKTLEEYRSAADELAKIDEKLAADRKELYAQFTADYATHKIGDIMDIPPGIYSDGRTRFRINEIKGYLGPDYSGRRVICRIDYYGPIIRKDGCVGTREHRETVFIKR